MQNIWKEMEKTNESMNEKKNLIQPTKTFDNVNDKNVLRKLQTNGKPHHCLHTALEIQWKNPLFSIRSYFAFYKIL